MLVGYYVNGLQKEVQNTDAGVDVGAGLDNLVETNTRAKKRFGFINPSSSKKKSKKKNKKGKKKKRSTNDSSEDELDFDSDLDTDADTDSDSDFGSNFNSKESSDSEERDEDVAKTAFITEWGVFAYIVMSFGLKNGPSSYLKAAFKNFELYLTKFMRILMDDFFVFGEKNNHLEYLRKCLERYRLFWMSLNPYKCVIAVQRGKLLENIISKEGIFIDSYKIISIQKAIAPNNVKEISKFMGQIKWHNQNLRYLADVSASLTHLTKKDVDFIWGDEKPKCKKTR
ncbi:hypothetical protein L7F22_023082 [Adiantum nelumboides]|nr:hypothetical protein [Adiantum nelumboides]